MFRKVVNRIRNIMAPPCSWCSEKSVSTHTVTNRTADGWLTSREVRACKRHMNGGGQLRAAERIRVKGKGAWASWWR